MEPERAAADGLPPQPGDEKRARRMTEVIRISGDAQRRIEPGIEASVELGEVRLEAVPSVAMDRVHDVDLDQRGGEEPLDLTHRAHQSFPLRVAERFEQGP